MGLIRTALRSRLVSALTSPHDIDDYAEHVHPMLTVQSPRARVTGVVNETGDSTTVWLRPNGVWNGFRPGQHVQFGVEVDGVRKIRCFSVSSSDTSKRAFSVSVKAHPDGYVSQFLKHELTPGTLVHLSEPEGEFTLPNPVPDDILLLSGGSGITPVMSMLRSLRDRGHSGRVTFVHYARSRDDEMFTEELDDIAATCDFARVVRIYTRTPQAGTQLSGRFTPDHLAGLGIEPGVTPAWVCGPAGMIEAVSAAYREGSAEDRLHSEYFKVPSVDLSAADATGMITFAESDHSEQNSGATLLEQAESAGLRPEFGCRMGVCNTCAVTKESGAVRHVITGDVRANTDEITKICVNVPVGDVDIAL